MFRLKMNLIDSDHRSIPLLFEMEGNYTTVDGPLLSSELEPQSSSNIACLSINVPPLEDLYGESYWNDFREKNSDEETEFALEVVVNTVSLASKKDFHNPFEMKPVSIKQTIRLKPRSKDEMQLLSHWYDNTPPEMLPKLYGFMVFPSPHKVPKSVFTLIDRPPWVFIRLGNRYPGPPNIPKTWQSWKELEESITPSTMRDEIRLTRIIIQYCDTKDTKVLEELKEWFAGMNEIQRTCMAKSVRDRTSGSTGTEWLAPYRDLYKTIREYDLAAKSESESERLKTLKLLE